MSDRELLRDRLDGFGKSLFDSADVDAPGPGSRDALLASLGLSAAVTGAAATAAPTVASAGAATKGLAASTTATAIGMKGTALGVKALVVAVLATGGAVAIHQAMKPATPAPVVTVAPVATPAPIASTVTPSELVDAPPDNGKTENAKTESAKAKATGSHATKSLVAPALAEQVHLLDEARTALRQGDAATALEATRRFEQKFGSGSALAPESMLVAVQAHLARGDRASAQRVLAKLEREHPASAATRRARELLE